MKTPRGYIRYLLKAYILGIINIWEIFRGDTNTKTMFNYLLNELGMKNAKNVMLSGLSAGGVAAFAWGDYLGSLLDTKINYVVALDGGYLNDVVHSSMKIKGGAIMASNLYSVANAYAPHPNSKCVQANRNNPYVCLFGD